MSEGEDRRLDLRRLPPVPPELQPEAPARISQTLAKRADVCPRSAYFYLRFGGGAPGVELVRGTVVHLFGEKMMIDLMRTGERTLFAPQEADPDAEPGDPAFHPEDRIRAAREVASLTSEIVHEIMLEHPDLTLPAAEIDDVREMAYHMAVGLDVNPEEVVAVERKFVLDLPSGWTISGKLDLASLPARDLELLEIHDYKSTMNFPTKEEWLRGWQPRFYGLLALFGQPVERVTCSTCEGQQVVRIEAQTTGAPAVEAECPDCGGRGSVEIRLPSIGEHIQRVHARELYPRYLVEKPGLPVVVKSTDELEPMILTRQNLIDFMADVELAVARVDRGLAEGEWPAQHGAHCTECAGRMVCPIPAHLRRYAGAINTHAEAAEAMAWAVTQGARVEATKKEVKSFAKAHGPVEVEAGRYELVVSEGQKMKTKGSRSDWEGLRLAVQGAVDFGHPFSIDEWVKPTTTTSLKLVKGDVNERERTAAGADEPGAARHAGQGRGDAGDRWGDDVPWDDDSAE